jgi:hypothetical protein
MVKLITMTADRLLGAIVPHATAAAWSCPSGCVRRTCYCGWNGHGYVWYNDCVSSRGGYACKVCTATVWTC